MMEYECDPSKETSTALLSQITADRDYCSIVYLCRLFVRPLVSHRALKWQQRERDVEQLPPETTHFKIKATTTFV